MSSVWSVEGTGEYPTDIVGESHYEDELERIVGNNGEVEFVAALIPEPDNRYDSNAVAVHHHQHGPVGHLSRDLAAEWQPLLLDVRRRFGATVTCNAIAGGRVGGPIGVSLDIELEDLQREVERRATEHGNVNAETVASWAMRRGDDIWQAAGVAQLAEWAKAGRLLASDYVFNPILREWMYARDTAELQKIFADHNRREQSKRGTSRTGLGLLFGGLVIGWVVWWPVGILTSIVGVVMVLTHALSRGASAPIAVTSPAPRVADVMSGEAIADTSRPPLALIGLFVVLPVIGVILLVYFANRKSDVVAAPSGSAIRSSVVTTSRAPEAEDLDAINRRLAALAQTSATVAETAPSPAPAPSARPSSEELQRIIGQNNTGPAPTRENNAAPVSPNTENAPRGVEQVYAADRLYYREDCTHPDGATRLPKAMAIRQGFRPAPSCYQPTLAQP